MAGGKEWAKYTPEERAARAKAQSERCRKMNLARSAAMKHRIASEMGKANKGKKHSSELVAKRQEWRNDPIKDKKMRAKQSRITTEANREDPVLREARSEYGRRNLRNYRKENVSEEDWWARNYKLVRHQQRMADTRRKLNSIGLDLIPKPPTHYGGKTQFYGTVSEQYLDDVDEFFAEVW